MTVTSNLLHQIESRGFFM